MLKSLDQPDVGAIPGLPRLMEYMTVEHGFVMVSVAFASGGARGRRSVRASRSTTRNAQKPNVTAGRSTAMLYASPSYVDSANRYSMGLMSVRAVSRRVRSSAFNPAMLPHPMS